MTEGSGPRPVVGALDVGGTKIIGALIDLDRRVLHRRRTPTTGPTGAADPELRAVVSAATDLRTTAERSGWRIAAVGAGFPEYAHDGRVTSDEVLGAGIAPERTLADCFGDVPVVIDSDVRLGALAESRLGAGRALGSFVYVSWGTGLSSTLAINGNCWPGEHGEAIALGEFPLPAELAEPPGTLEAFASGTAIADRYGAKSGTPVDDGAREVLARQQAGDSAAEQVIVSAASALGIALAAVVRLTDPAAVIIGGGLGTGDDPLVERVFQVARARLPKGRDRQWLRAGLGPDSALLGAALLAADAVSRSAE